MTDANLTLSALAKALREGESVARVQRVPFTDPKATANAGKTLNKMRNSVNQIAVKARENGDRQYRVESGQFMTADGTALMLVVTLTCMDDEGEDDI